MSKFLTPSDVPEDVVCRTLKIPNSLQWLGIFNKALLAPTYPYNWSDDVAGSMTREEAAEAARVIVADFLDGSLECDVCTVPGGTPVVSLDEFGSWRMLDDGGWSAPSGAYTLPSYTARTETTAEERMCLAAKNAAKVLADVYEQLSDDATEHLTTAEILFNIGLAIGLAIFTPVGALAVAALAIGISAFQFAIAIAEVITEDVWDAEFTEALVCTLLGNATDAAGVVTFNFQGVKQDLLTQTYWTDPTFLSQQLAAQVNFLLETIGAEGLNLAGETTSITDSDCTACGGEYVFDFNANGEQFWTPVAPAHAQWDSGLSCWKMVCTGGIGSTAELRVERIVAVNSLFTHVEVDVEVLGTGITEFNFFVRVASVWTLAATFGAASAGIQTLGGDITPISGDGLRVDFADADGCGSTDLYLNIARFTFE